MRLGYYDHRGFADEVSESFVSSFNLWLFCNDKNFPATGPAVAPGVHIDLTEAYDTIQKIRQMADILIPLHDLSIGRMERIP